MVKRILKEEAKTGKTNIVGQGSESSNKPNELVESQNATQRTTPEQGSRPSHTLAPGTPNTIKETVQQTKPAERSNTAVNETRQHSPVQEEIASAELTKTPVSNRAIKEKPQIAKEERSETSSKVLLTNGNEEDRLPVQENAAEQQEDFIKNPPVVPISQIKGTRKTYKDISGQVDSALEEVKTKSSGIHPDKIKLNTSSRVTITPGINEYIPIAKNHVNRIVTPFVSPSITSIGLTAGNGKDGTCGEICVKGNVIYLSTDKNDPVSMFITEQGSEEQALSITVVPQDIPPREVFLQLSAEAKGSKAASDSLAQDNLEAETFEKSQPYVEAIRQMMRSVALGQVPSGYVLGMARGAKNIPSCRQNGLSFNFKDGQRLTGHNLDLFIGVVKNVSREAIEFNEMSCGSWQTAAVASYPLHVLQPGQMSEVYIVMKEARMPAPKPQRPSLIPRDYGYR